MAIMAICKTKRHYLPPLKQPSRSSRCVPQRVAPQLMHLLNRRIHEALWPTGPQQKTVRSAMSGTHSASISLETRPLRADAPPPSPVSVHSIRIEALLHSVFDSSWVSLAIFSRNSRSTMSTSKRDECTSTTSTGSCGAMPPPGGCARGGGQWAGTHGPPRSVPARRVEEDNGTR